MQVEQTLASRLERLGKHQPSEPTHAKGWLDDLKDEIAARRQAEAVAQYQRDALMTRMMIELNRVHAVELLEEMNRELLDNDGRVEPIYTTRHELCLSWPTVNGRHEIYVAADVRPGYADERLILAVRGEDEQIVSMDEEALKGALIKAFRQPLLNIHKWQ
jgi:hypothetical protein